MSIHQLEVQNFRNLQNTQLEFSPLLNLVIGDNAQGKTNLVEAIYFAATGKSFRTQDLTSLIRENSAQLHLEMQFLHHGLESELKLSLSQDVKELSLLGKKIRSWQKIHALLRVLVFTPDSTLLFRSTPSVKRRYFDQAMSFQFPQYAKLLGRYQRTLRQRNLLLEELAPERLLAPFDQQWAELSAEILRMRRDFLQTLLLDWRKRLSELSDFSANFSAAWQGKLDYERDWDAESLKAELKATAFQEKRYRRTVIGPHLDGVQAFFSGKVLREVASQGQQRMVVIALKLAQADFFQSHNQLAPVFLLDDIGSELDANHLKNLLQTLKQLGAQTFLTTTHSLKMDFSDLKSFQLKQGKIQATSL
ncbi:MAG: DNA replication and repair protein RecF [Deltaproteobacteria bacterium]|nr:DNA replication and repair protein RecF [Deltaproteobacteria bacterium]